jgi:glucose/arabinose dehydrogenase
MALHPSFAQNHLVYLVYTAQAAGRLVNRLVRFREVANTLGEPAVLLDDITAAGIHNGSRLRFGPDGKLYMTMGDAANAPVAQDLARLNGKFLRLNDDGTTPADNPFGSPIWSYGHRNPQGLDWHPATGELWATEHGATGNDELNRIVAGRNYGWPVIEGEATRPDMETPVLFFSPSIAPSGASFYTGTAFPTFRNNLFFATLAGGHLHRVRFDPADPRRVLAHERLLQGRFGRIRDVVTGPDGALYFCTSNNTGGGGLAPEDDRILRLVPAR